MRQTRLVVPQAPASQLPRERLDARAVDVLAVPVTVVRAGGGYGKTTLLSTWAEALRSRTRVAWITFESADAAPTAILEALANAFVHSLNGVGTGVSQLLERGIDRVDSLVASLSNELLAWTEEEDADVVLFADDVQFAVEHSGAAAAFGAFVAALPPRAHIVLATRIPLRFSPLAKLRSSGRIVELDQDDLRFTSDETTALIGADAAPIFYERTEGWPIAVGLLAQMLRRDPRQHDRALATTRETLFEFLADDVVGRLPERTQSSLYALAIPDTIDDVVSIEYLGAPSAHAVIADLEQVGPYVTKSGEGTWRLHSLFREYLVAKLEEMDAAHIRALRVTYANVLRKHGRNFEALDQILAAGAYDEVVQYALDTVLSIRFTDRYAQFAQLMRRVPDAVFAENPQLHRYFAIALRRDSRDEEAMEQFERCYERAMRKENWRLAVVAQIEMGITVDDFFSLLRRDYLRSEKHFLRALELSEMPELDDQPKARLDAHWHLGMVYACRGRFDEAERHLDVAERLELRSDSHRESVLVEYAEILSWRGLWQRALDKAELAEEILSRGDGTHLGRAVLMQARALRALGEASGRSIELASRSVALLNDGHQQEELALAHSVVAQCALDLVPSDIARARANVSDAKAWLSRFPNRSHEFSVALAEYRVASIVESDERISQDLRRLRLLASANDDPWQQAMVIYEEAEHAAKNDPLRAVDGFRVSAKRFRELGDAYHASLGDIAAVAVSPAVAQNDIETTLRLLHEHGLMYALKAVPHHSVSLLVTLLRKDNASHAVLALLEALRNRPQHLVEVVENEEELPAVRGAVLEALSRFDVRRARNLALRYRQSQDEILSNVSKSVMENVVSQEVPELFVHVVGRLRVRLGEEEVLENDPRWARRRSAELLRFLSIAGAPVTRDAIVSALWPDNPSVLDTTFRVTLHLLRRALQPDVDGAGDYIGYDGNVAWIRPEVLRGSDAEVASRALRDASLAFEKGDFTSSVEKVDYAIGVFSGAPREDSVEDWLRPRVRAWRDNAVSALLLRAAISRAQHTAEDEITFLERAYAVEPLHETTVVHLLDALASAGRVESAKRVYGDYRRRLQDQLSLTPGPALVERYARILGKSKSDHQERLSEREREVVTHIGKGRSNKEIAAILGLSVWTINNHVAKILKKLNVQSRSAAVVAAGITADD